jgi:hypothetical protein
LGILIGVLASIKNGKFFKFFKFLFSCFYTDNNNENKKEIFKYNNNPSNNEKMKINSGHFFSDFYKKNKFLNFWNKNFDFSAIGITDSFSVPILLIAESIYDINKNLLDIHIKEIIYSDNFIYFCKNKGIINILDIGFIQSKINIKGFLTDDAMFNTLIL